MVVVESANTTTLTYLSGVSLNNPLILSAGLYGTSPHKNSPVAAGFGERYIEKLIVDYTANRTEYDDHFLMEVVPDKRYIIIRYFEKATDEDVDALLALTGWMAP